MKYTGFFIFIALLMVIFPGYVLAMPMAFTDRASFDSEVSRLFNSEIRVLDFEGASSGDIILPGDSLKGITFTYLIDDGMGGMLDLKVTDRFDTTSGNNYLGLDDPGNFDQFIAGDGFNIDLGGPFNAIGLYFITSDPLFIGDILLQTALGVAVNSGMQEAMLDDGGFVYFVGLVSPDFSFGSAQIRFDTAAVGTFLYNVDDIVTAKIPEPGTVVLVLVGLLGIYFCRSSSRGGMS